MVAFALAAALAQPTQPPLKDQYTKTEYMIPMRDGVKLYTAVYAPKNTSGPSPMIMQRTPYSAGPYGPDNYKGGFGGSPKFRENGYIFVYQDVRGKYMSEGEFVNVRPQNLAKGPKDIDESTDTWDTIQFLVDNVPNNNGRVGLWGISYPGFYAGVGAIDSHPALRASSPQAPVSDWWIGDDFHHLGAFFLQDAVSFFSGFGQPRPQPTPNRPEGVRIDLQGDAYKAFLEIGPLRNVDEKIFKGSVAFWKDLMTHGNYDAFWQARSLPKHMTNVKAALLVVGGWFDAEDLWGAINLYKLAHKQNPTTPMYFVMGPWPHGGWAGGPGSRFGDIDMPGEPSTFYREQIEWPFFDAYLRGDGKPGIPQVQVYETGTGKWRTPTEWPPKEAKPRSLYFSDARELRWMAPTEPDSQEDSYLSDPAAPVPYQGGTLGRRSREYMIDDQRFAEARMDVLTYRSDPLSSDFTIAGPVKADLWISMTGTDADFVVKIIDEYPSDAPANSAGKAMAGYQMLVRAEVLRGKFHSNYSNPVPFVPKKITNVKYELPDTLHTFRKGHRIVVQVQSSWFPLVDRNPQKFCDIYSATEADFKAETISLWRTKEHPSRVAFGVLTGD